MSIGRRSRSLASRGAPNPAKERATEKRSGGSLSLAISSDIHVEFHRDHGAAFIAGMPDSDVLVCAGDLGNAKTFAEALEALCRRYPHVIYVMGNHEAYGSSISDVRRTLDAMDARLPGLHYLENNTCEIDGQRFVGSTLWVPRLPGIEVLEPMMNDFRLINDAPDAIYDENTRAVDWLAKVVRSTDVVVTHHLPSPRSVVSCPGGPS